MRDLTGGKAVEHDENDIERSMSVASSAPKDPPRPKPIEITKSNTFREDDVSAAGMSNDEVPAVAAGRRVPPELEAEAAAFFEQEHEDKVVSATKQSVKSSEEDDLPPLAPLSPSEQVNAAPIIEAFGEDVIVKLFSQAWLHRETALQAINKRLIAAWENADSSAVVGAEPRETFHTLCKTLGDRLFNDKVANVTCAAAITLASAAKAYAEFVSARDVREAVGDSMSLLVDKLGDTNPRLRESIRERRPRRSEYLSECALQTGAKVELVASADWKAHSASRACANVRIGCARKGKFIRVGTSHEVCDEVLRQRQR
jgi:centrosomal protein CEP104